MLAELEEVVYPLNRTFVTASDRGEKGEIASPCFLSTKKIKVSVCAFEPLRRNNDPATTGGRGTLNSSIYHPSQQFLE